MQQQIIAAASALACTLGAAAQTGTPPQAARQQAEQAVKDMNRQQAGKITACALVTRADVQKATGRDPQRDPEAFGEWICNFGAGELKLYRSWEGWEQTLKAFKKDKEPRTSAPAFGGRAHYLLVKPDNKYQNSVAFLAAHSGAYVVALSLDMPPGQDKGLDAMRPALDALMKASLARIPR